ncbi:MAG: hypothetical protein KGV50_02305 [Gammaproteobacteria bacterium]|nr:hypothetical protein [Gammaproteobacteria bacterium]
MNKSDGKNILSQDDTVLLKTTISLLRTATVVVPFNILYVVITVYLYQSAVIPLLVSFLLLLSAVYLHIRIAFDIPLFMQLKEGVKPQDIDKSLCALGLLSEVTERSINSRCRGAVRLWKRLLVTTLLQCVVIVTNVVVSYF